MSISSATPQLRNLLLENKIVTDGELRDALNTIEKRGGKIAETLIELGYLKMEVLEKFILEQPGIATIDITQYKIMGELCQLIPAELVRAHQLFPIDRMRDHLTVGMAMPLDSATIAELVSVTGLKVKAVYCNPSHIADAILRYYPIEPDKPQTFNLSKGPANGPASMMTIATLLREIDNLPSLPETVTKTKEALDNSAIDIEEVETLIERDPLVAAKVLKLANSAAYSFSGTIDKVSMATRLLGLQETYNLVLASSVLSLAENASGFDYKRFWHEALFAAASVTSIARLVGARPSPALSTAALLHDIGRFAMAQTSPEAYKKIDSELVGKQLVAVEEEILGLSHTEAGFAVADHWELPVEITTLIRYHHAPELADQLQQDACILSLATFLSEAHIKGDAPQQNGDFNDIQHALHHLGISTEQLMDAYRDIAADFSV